MRATMRARVNDPDRGGRVSKHFIEVVTAGPNDRND